MKIQVKDPVTNEAIEMHAEQEDINEQYGWRITSTTYGTILILENGGYWQASGRDDISADLIREIGVALHPLARYNSLT